jgi:photosystem II stability/assembly factor-like uncharacterized protein
LVELAAALAAAAIGPAPLGATVAWGDPHHAWAAGGGGIVATTNAGASWHVESRRPVRQVVAVDGSHAWALSREFTLRTTNGRHWESLGAQAVLRMSFVDRMNGFAIERLYYLVRTRDGGTTWTPMNGPKQLQSLCFSDARTGWVARGGTVWTTDDAGARWTKRTLMRERQGFPTPELYCHGNDVWLVLHRGFALGTEGYSIYRSLDDGTTWRLLFASFSNRLPRVSNYAGPVAAIAGKVAVLEGSCPACGRGSVTFVRTPTHARKTIEDVLPGPLAFATRSLGVAVLTRMPRRMPTIYRTTDGGRTWTRTLASRLLRP